MSFPEMLTDVAQHAAQARTDLASMKLTLAAHGDVLNRDDLMRFLIASLSVHDQTLDLLQKVAEYLS